MKIAITSGKGGVGKTFVATSLAHVLSQEKPVDLIDCDVEAPNAHLFITPDNRDEAPQFHPCVTAIDETRCTACGACAQACEFNALMISKKAKMVFPELCHSCWACKHVCPQDAIVTTDRCVGHIYSGQAGQIQLTWATLATGAGGQSPRLINLVKQKAQAEITLLDSPPGTSCSVVETIQGADLVVLVADPTRFGLHDLKLSVQLCRSLDIEPVVIINRSGLADMTPIRRYAHLHQLTIVGELPDDRTIAQYYSNGQMAVDFLPDLNKQFSDMGKRLIELSSKHRPVCHGPAESLFLDTYSPNGSDQKEAAEEIVQTTKPIEVTIVSGKGGSGKTSLSACFAQLAKSTVVDADVDAADLHLIFSPQIAQTSEFTGGKLMSIDSQTCKACGICFDNCQFDAIEVKDGAYTIDPQQCEGCGACVILCPVNAVQSQQRVNGRWYYSNYRFGSMSHATLTPGEENSGRLVTLIRKNATQWAKKADEKHPIVLDGSPGTGCPVIASVGGARFAVIVTEPTVSGLHDLKRILELTAHFKVPSAVIINKADLNQEQTQLIIDESNARQAIVLGTLPYDTTVVEAQQKGQTVLEYTPQSELSKQIKTIWKSILAQLT